MSTDDTTKKQWDHKKHQDDMGINASVDRGQEEGEYVTRANLALCDIGDFLHKEKPSLVGLEYAGSAAVHIYYAPTLGEMAFITQTAPLRETNEMMAGSAFTQLKKDLMAKYGRNPGKARSGF